MNQVSSGPRGRSALSPVLFAVALGLSGGLIEGVGHMVLQRLNVLENAWWEIVWISAIANTLLMAALGAVVAVILRRTGDRARLRTAAVFLLVLTALLPVFALMLKEWVKTYAIFLLLLGITVALTRGVRAREDAVARLSARSIPWLIAVTIAAFAIINGGAWLQERRATGNLPAAAAAAPDVLVVVIDTLRADHVGAYGYSRPLSPIADGLARQGVLFENAFSASSYTLPSHASILTGLPPEQHRVEWGTSQQRQEPPYPTLPKTLQGHGYRTGAFSGNTFYFSREHGFGRGFLHFEDFFHSVTDMVMRTAYGRIVSKAVLPRFGYEDIPGRKTAADTNRAVMAWLERDRTRPAFVMINYMDAHDPYLPPEPYRSRFSKQPGPGGLINSNFHVPKVLPPDQLQSEIDAYDGAIAYMDEQLGQLIAAMRSRPGARPLAVILTSDHGEEFHEHGGFLHGSHLYREVIQVPLIVSFPGRIPEGRRVSQPVSNAAIPATILSLLSPGDTTFPGPPLQGLWDGTASTAPSVLSELKQRPWAPAGEPVHDGALRSLVTPEWHYIENDGRKLQLFDYVRDVREQANLAESAEATALVDRFQSEMSTRSENSTARQRARAAQP